MGWAEQKHLVWARTWRPNEKLSSSTMISPRSPSITDDLHADVALSRFFCHCKVRSRFWWFFKSFLGESKITGKFEMTFVSWNWWLASKTHFVGKWLMRYWFREFLKKKKKENSIVNSWCMRNCAKGIYLIKSREWDWSLVFYFLYFLWRNSF